MTNNGHSSILMGPRYGSHPYDDEYPGRMIIVEGIDGSGKSTQIDLLAKWLTSRDYVTVFTEWNSSPIVRRTTKRGKDDRSLTPMSFSLIHAADFANRVFTQILPALKAGTIVLADRYVYTAFARDSARGVNRDWLRRVYAFAIRPSLALYFKVPLDESIRRIVTGRDEYDRLSSEFELVTIDATQPIHEQQQMVRQLVEPLLAGVMRMPGHSVTDALVSSGLTGRYIQQSGSRRVPELATATDG